MNRLASTERQPPGDVVAEVERLCDVSRFLAAHTLVGEYAPFESWESADALCTAARLVQHLGGYSRSDRLALRAYRRDPSSAEARFWVGMDWLAQRGPLAAWTWLGAYEPPDGTPGRYVASVHWLRTAIATVLRDFDEAERQLDRADAVAPDEPYGSTMRVSWLEQQDRYDEALELARSAVERHPAHRPSIQALASLLQVHGRFEEALSVLEQAAPALESGALWLDAASLQKELGRHRESMASVDNAERCCPLLEEIGKKRLAAFRADAAYHTGDEETALREAKKVGLPFFDSIAERLSRPRTNERRVQLEVAFVRQHHLTCVPATLSMLGRFWKREVDQLEVADQICYDGTRSHSERVWADKTGWKWRELTVTWDVARALIDRGVPFSVDTVHAVSAHAQAIVGYDERRGTLTIRDPYVPTKIEALGEPFLADYAAHGPRGFALVPPDRADVLHGIDLPDAELFAIADRIESALERHDRPEAAAALTELQQRAPDHRLVLSARRGLAAYDANPFEQLAVAEAALQRFPNEPTWLLARLGALRETGTSEAHRAALETLCEDEKLHPVFREMLASELMRDARQLDRAGRMLRRVATQLRDRAATLALLGDCHWYHRDFERAVALHRFAACLEPTNEAAAQEYFRCALASNRPEEALGFLERRAERYRKRAAAPAISAFIALEQLDKTHRGFELLARALEARPDDGELLAFAAVAHARYGELEAAEARLAQAERCLPRHRWARIAARISTLSADHERALELWREVAEALPLDVDVHRALASRIAAVHGIAKACEHTAAASARFPENAALLALHIQGLTAEDPRAVEAALRRLLVLEPSNAWAHRELALTLAKLGRFADAERECAVAREVSPYEVSTELVTARLSELQGRHAAARDAYRAALELDADSTLAIARLVECAESAKESKQLLDVIEREVTEHGINGDGLVAWFQNARRRLEPDDVGARLERIRSQRSELWATWFCSAQHARLSGDNVAATELAKTAVERCPLVPALWLELASAYRDAGQLDEERAALERAVAISPSFVTATLALARALERGDAEDRGLSALERGLRFEPLDGSLLVARAEVLWRLGRRSDAIAALNRAIEVDSTDGDAWARLAEWDQSDDFDAAGAIEKLAARRPWDAGLWYRLADIQSSSDPARALENVERALELDPSAIDVHDLRAVIAASLGHKTLALSACRPKHFGERVPLALRGREAWVHAHFGDVQQALARMKTVVAEWGDYAWGWRQIADWAERLGDKETALEAAQTLVRLEPSAAFVHGYLGEALAVAERTDEALAAFRRAIQLDPSYRYGVHRYLELLLAAGQLARARKTLRRHARHLPPHDVRLFELRFAIAEKDRRAAEEAARALVSDPDAGDHIVEVARAELTEASFELADRMLFEVASDPDAPPRAGAAWARTACARFFGPKPSELRRLVRENPDAAAEAIDVVIGHYGDQGRAGDAFGVVLRNWRFVRSRDALWGQFGYALTNGGYRVFTVLWLWSYERRQPGSWMLLNLVVALRDLGFAAAARRVGRDALSLTPDSAFPAHATWLALDAALEHGTDEARLLLADVGAGQLAPWFERIHDLVARLIELESAPAAERASAAESAFHALHLIHPRGFRSLFALEAIQWRRVARRIGRSGRSLSILVRGYWDSAFALLVLLFLIYAVVVTQGRAILYFLIGSVVVAVLRRVRFS